MVKSIINTSGVPRYALAWSEGTDSGRQKTRNHGYDVIQAESYLLIAIPITLANLSR